MSNNNILIDGRVLNIILLSAINVVKQISNIDLVKKHIFSTQNSLTINSDLLLIKLSGDIEGDILIKFDEQLKSKILENFLKDFSNLNDSNNSSVVQSAFNEIGNLISAKISNFLCADNKKVNISSVGFLKQKDEISYESIFTVEMTSNFGDLSIYLGINELKFERSISFIFFGFSEESMEELTNEFIPKGFEIYYSQNAAEFITLIKSKKIDIAVIDFYVVNQEIKFFLKSCFSSLEYKINLIFGVTKLDIIKFQGLPTNSDNYQLIGLFLKTFSIKEIISYIYNILQKIGIKPDDRRKHIRVTIADNNRFFISVNDKEFKFTAKLLDISLGGFKAEFDKNSEKKEISVGKLINSADLFLKYNRLKVSCKVVYISDNTFSASFVNLVDTDKNIISNAIFKLLSNK